VLLDGTSFHRLCTDFPADPAARLPVAAIKPAWCSASASADRPVMSEDEQRAKLRLVETAARYYWGDEI
jgi:hypothetical protein